MLLQSWLGAVGLALSVSMAAATVAASRKPGGRPPYLSLVFAEASAFFLATLFSRIRGGAFIASALSYCGSLLGLPSLYLYERSVTGEPIGRPARHYLPFFANLPLGLMAAWSTHAGMKGSAVALYYVALTLAQTIQLAAYGRAALRLAKGYGGKPNWLARISTAILAGYGAIVAMGWAIVGMAAAEELLGRDIEAAPWIDPLSLLTALFLAWTLGLCLVWGGDRGSEPATEALRYGGRGFPEAEAMELVRRARAMLAEEPDLSSESVRPRSLATRLGVPYYALSRAINEREGMSLLDLVNEYRVERAKEILAGRLEASVIDACFEAGFQAKSTFNEVFKKSVGMSPGDYRRRLARVREGEAGAARDPQPSSFL